MADNVTLPVTGTGTADVVQATDDVAGVQFPLVKLVDGTVDSTTVIAAGGGVEAGALRVTLASDSTGLVSVDDNGGSLTVDGSITAVQATGTNLHTVVDSGTITTITNVVHVDDNASTLSVDDGAGSLTVDNAQLSVVGSGTEATALRVTVATDSTGVVSIDDNAGSLTVDGSVTVTQATGTNLHAVVDSGTITTVSTVTTLGTVTNVVHVDDNAGNLSIDDGGNSITVDNGGTFAVQATIASGATNIAKAEDVPSADADVGVPAMAVRKATPANTSSLDGDYEMLQMSVGRLWTSTTVDAALPAGTNNIGDVDVLTVPAPLSTTGNGTAATALRVSIASDTTGVLAVTDNAGSLTVDNATISVVGSGTEATAQRVTIATDSTGVLSVDDNGGNLSIDDGGNSITVDNTVLSVVGSGTEATAQRVTIATDSTGVLSVDDNGGNLSVDDGAGSLTVDAPVATPVFVRLSDGAAAISALPITDNAGSLTVDQPTGTNLHMVVDSGTITTVSTVTAVTSITNVVHVDDNAGSLTVDNAVLSVVGGGTEATAQRVTIATDSTGVLSIDDNGASVTVDAPLGTPLFVTTTPGTTGGWSKWSSPKNGTSNNPLTNVVQTIKGSAGSFGGYMVYNPNATVAYLQVFDSTTAAAGTTKADIIVPIPAGSAANIEMANGVNMATGIQACATTTATGSTALATAGLDLTVWYK